MDEKFKCAGETGSRVDSTSFFRSIGKKLKLLPSVFLSTFVRGYFHIQGKHCGRGHE